jgi:hypothetical protein
LEKAMTMVPKGPVDSWLTIEDEAIKRLVIPIRKLA